MNKRILNIDPSNTELLAKHKQEYAEYVLDFLNIQGNSQKLADALGLAISTISAYKIGRRNLSAKQGHKWANAIYGLTSGKKKTASKKKKKSTTKKKKAVSKKKKTVSKKKKAASKKKKKSTSRKKR